jgi:hypothetical protein
LEPEPSWRIHHQGSFGENDNKITFYGTDLISYTAYILNDGHPRSGIQFNPYSNLPISFSPWRDTSPHFYLGNGHEYIDFSDTSDFPDYHTISQSVAIKYGVGGTIGGMADRFGNIYLFIAANIGVGGGILPYSETYVSADIYDALVLSRKTYPTEEELTSMGVCSGLSISVIVGRGFGVCPYAFNISSIPYRLGAYETWSTGIQGGISYDLSYTKRIPGAHLG